MRIALIVFLLICISCESLLAQSTDLSSAYETDVKIRKTGMAILGSWAIANIATGAIGRNNTTGTQSYFHEMNLIWNVVNLGIAGAGYYFTANGDVPDNAGTLISDQFSFQKTLLFNAGLDLAYIAGGFFLLERAKNTTNRTERLKGYGQSVILQGSFLFLFDLILHTIHHRNVAEVSDFLSHLQLAPNSVGVLLKF